MTRDVVVADAADHVAWNNLCRLAAYVASLAQTDSMRRRFYRFFQFVRLDSKPAARVVVEFLGLGGKPWVLAIDRTNWDFVLRLIFGALIRAAERWKSIKVTEFERRQMAAVKKELN